MNMIGHNHVPPDPPSIRFLRRGNECSVERIISQVVSSGLRTNGDEDNCSDVVPNNWNRMSEILSLAEVDIQEEEKELDKVWRQVTARR